MQANLSLATTEEYFTMHSGVIAFNENGEKLWQFSSNNQDWDGGIALAGDGTLYLASRFLYALATKPVNRNGILI